MPNVKFVAATGDPYVDGLMSGRAWNASSLTFSFPASASFYGSGYGDGEPQNGFQPFNAQQQAAARAVLAQFDAVINLGFSEVTESASVHGDLRFAESSMVSTAWGYYPSTAPEGGDSWYSASGTYDAPRLGTYAYLTILHEVGHNLGLKHPHQASGSFGALPADRDSLEYTVMSYRSDVGAATDYYRNGSTSYPETLMMLDIAALQKMYGANYATNAGDTVYRWSPSTGQMFVDGVGQASPAGNKIFMTLWDGGGTDTFDFSAYAGALSVDLAPGGWTTVSTTQLAYLGNGGVAVGNIANALLFEGNPASLIENAIGGSSHDTILGNDAANRLTGGRGNDVLDGRAGFDTATFSGRLADYTITENANGSWTVADNRAIDGTDTLWNVEAFAFTDATVRGASGGTVVVVGSGTGDPGTTDTVFTPVNAAPVAVKDVFAVKKNKKLKVGEAGVLANDRDADGDSLHATLVSGPRKGKFKLDDDGSFVFKAPKGFKGKLKAKYQADDGTDMSAPAKVVFKVMNKKAYAEAMAADAAGIGDDHGLDTIPAPTPYDAGHDFAARFADGLDLYAGLSPGAAGLDRYDDQPGWSLDLHL